MVDWFREKLYPTVLQSFARNTPLYEGKTAFQQVEIFENDALGRVMALDGIVQTTERDEFIYHEMLAHVPLFAHGAAHDVLIIGGGDGGALREVLRHGVSRVTMVDIDGEVIDLSRRYLPNLSAGAFDDPRATVVVGDGLQFVADTQERYDVIIVDSTDPIGPGEGLFTRTFYARCAEILTARGVVITQNGVPFLQPEELRRTWQRFEGTFEHRGFYVIAVPTYYGGFMALGWGSNGIDLAAPDMEGVASRFEQSGLETRYYNPAIHQGAFALPQFVQNLLIDETP